MKDPDYLKTDQLHFWCYYYILATIHVLYICIVILKSSPAIKVLNGWTRAVPISTWSQKCMNLRKVAAYIILFFSLYLWWYWVLYTVFMINWVTLTKNWEKVYCLCFPLQISMLPMSLFAQLCPSNWLVY